MNASSIATGILCSTFLLLNSACKSKTGAGDQGSLKIYGGNQTKEFPEVHIFGVDGAKGHICSGVALSDTTAIMAGHCVKDPTLNDGVIALEKGARSEVIYTWLALKNLELMTDTTAARDLAVVVFPSGTFSPPFGELTLQRQEVGTEVKIVGYGASGFDGRSVDVRKSAGLKRAGSNKISEIREGLYVLQADLNNTQAANNAAAAAGDSGGPLYVKGRIAGLAAALYLTDANGRQTPVLQDDTGYPTPDVKGAVRAFNVFVDLSSEVSRKLLTYAVTKRAKIPGIESHSVQLDLTDNKWTVEAESKGSGSMVAMCGGWWLLRNMACSGNFNLGQMNGKNSFTISCSDSHGGPNNEPPREGPGGTPAGSRGPGGGRPPVGGNGGAGSGGGTGPRPGGGAEPGPGPGAQTPPPPRTQYGGPYGTGENPQETGGTPTPEGGEQKPTEGEEKPTEGEPQPTGGEPAGEAR